LITRMSIWGCGAMLAWVWMVCMEIAGGQTIMPTRPGGFQPPPTRVTTTTANTTTTLLLDIKCRGSLDIPANNSTVSGKVPIGGWIVPIRGDYSGEITSRLELRVDGNFVQLLTEKSQRPDVQNALAKERIKVQADVGYAGTWDSRTVADGVHLMWIRAIYVSGKRSRAIDIGRNIVWVKNSSTSRTPASSATTTTFPKKKVPGTGRR
jgi:hypothetical protein